MKTHIRFDELITALKEREYRLTPQRVELVRLIAASEGHPNAAQIYTRIKHQFPTMSQATVYKTLTLLKEMGQVLEIDLHGDSHFDGNHPEPHPHLVCLQCDKIIDGDVEFKPTAIHKLEQTTGYKILRSQVVHYGFCPECHNQTSTQP